MWAGDDACVEDTVGTNFGGVSLFVITKKCNRKISELVTMSRTPASCLIYPSSVEFPL